MQNMGDTAKLLAAAIERTVGGESLRFTPINFGIQAKFEVWLERRAIDRIRLQRPSLPASDYDAMMSAVTRDIAAGVYTWGQKTCVNALDSRPGVERLAYLSLVADHPDVTEEDINGLCDDDWVGLVEALSAAIEAGAPKARRTLAPERAKPASET
jgi:hypothetical protein